ncbi:MAG: Scr1 family TA system antitoxin-like transcriptional regulator [Carbonactinosporaceae bacterium]
MRPAWRSPLIPSRSTAPQRSRGRRLFHHSRQRSGERAVWRGLLEAALRVRPVSPDALAGQLDRLVAVSGLSNLELGVIPFETAVPVFPLGSFAVYDENLVVVETLTGEQRLDEPEEVATYDRFLDLLREAAATGRDAVPIIQRALDGIRHQ